MDAVGNMFAKCTCLEQKYTHLGLCCGCDQYEQHIVNGNGRTFVGNASDTILLGHQKYERLDEKNSAINHKQFTLVVLVRNVIFRSKNFMVSVCGRGRRVCLCVAGSVHFRKMLDMDGQKERVLETIRRCPRFSAQNSTTFQYFLSLVMCVIVNPR